MREVYIELFILNNLVINWGLLWAAAKIARVKERAWRLWASAVFGCAYCVLMFLPGCTFLQGFVFKALLFILMTVIAYTGKQYIKCSATFLGTSFFLGGVILGLYFLTGEVHIKNGMITVSPGISVIILGISAAVLFYWLFNKLVKSRKLDKYKYPARISFMDRCIRVTAFYDTGHSLTDPISSLPVIILSSKQSGLLFPKELLEDLALLRDNRPPVSEYGSRLRLIRFSTVAEHRVMPGVRVDSIEIERDGKPLLIEAIIGCADITLKNSDALLPSSIFDNVVLGGNV